MIVNVWLTLQDFQQPSAYYHLWKVPLAYARPQLASAIHPAFFSSWALVRHRHPTCRGLQSHFHPLGPRLQERTCRRLWEDLLWCPVWVLMIPQRLHQINS
jgi:hypothetical protein